jgi:hypothetical protein
MSDVYPLEEELNLLQADQIHFRRDGFDDLVLEHDGESYSGVRILRGFPHSAAGRMISVRDADGDELGIVPRLDELDGDSRQLVEDELRRAYFVPRITRVLKLQETFHVPSWEVETDRGPRRFEIRSGRRDIRVLGSRLLIRDADGNQYEVPDMRRLDADSLSLIDSQI